MIFVKWSIQYLFTPLLIIIWVYLIHEGKNALSAKQCMEYDGHRQIDTATMEKNMEIP